MELFSYREKKNHNNPLELLLLSSQDYPVSWKMLVNIPFAREEI